MAPPLAQMARNRTPAQQGAPVFAGVNPLWWLPAEMRGRAKDFFTATITLTVNATSTLAGSAAISGDSDFVLLSMTRMVFDNTGITVVAAPELLVTLSDSGSGRNLSDAAVHIEDMFGTGQLPAYLDVPKVFARNSVLTATVQNLAAATRIVRLAFRGFKVFDFPA